MKLNPLYEYIRLDENWSWGTILVRTRPEQLTSTLENLKQLCETMNPNIPFTYQFSDREFSKLYQGEQMVSSLATYFALLALFISCLGLFGLAAFMAGQRIKEIGVRKVLGASVGNVVYLLSADFVKLVLIAIIIACPIAWWTMNQWLEDFSYRIDIQWWIFVVAGSVVVLIALLTVSWQATQAALANPVDSLRDE